MRNSAYAIPFFCLTINKKYDIIKGDIYIIIIIFNNDDIKRGVTPSLCLRNITCILIYILLYVVHFNKK